MNQPFIPFFFLLLGDCTETGGEVSDKLEKQLQRLQEKHPRVPDFKLRVWAKMLVSLLIWIARQIWRTVNKLSCRWANTCRLTCYCTFDLGLIRSQHWIFKYIFRLMEVWQMKKKFQNFHSSAGKRQAHHRSQQQVQPKKHSQLGIR